jgi:hypothetical protein
VYVDPIILYIFIIYNFAGVIVRNEAAKERFEKEVNNSGFVLYFCFLHSVFDTKSKYCS